MSDNVVYFAHGKESGPWGTKIVRLAEIAKARGCRVESPDYSATVDPDERVSQLLALRPSAPKRLILVGSSMGGYVSAVASQQLHPAGLFLMAPAFYRAGYTQAEPRPHAGVTMIVHGWTDEVIPAESSIKYAQRFKAQLVLVDGDHRLTDALPVVEQAFGAFLNQVLGGPTR